MDETADDYDDKVWRDVLGTSPVTLHIFSCKPAMVKKQFVNGHRMWTEYDPAKFTEEEYEIVPGMWDHEHCRICDEKIQQGDGYWQNSQKQILCPTCYARFQKIYG